MAINSHRAGTALKCANLAFAVEVAYWEAVGDFEGAARLWMEGPYIRRWGKREQQATLILLQALRRLSAKALWALMG